MIRARTATACALATQLAAKAQAIAEAHGATRLLTLRDNPGRWRQARLLWPLFTKD